MSYTLSYTANEIDAYLGQVSVNQNNIGALYDKMNNISWDDLKEKPFRKIEISSNTLTWDGSDSEELILGDYHLLSYNTPRISDLINGSYTGMIDNIPKTVTITEDLITDNTAYIKISDYIVIAYMDNIIVDDYVTIPKAGTYFMRGEDASSRIVSLTCVNDVFIDFKIDEKHIPDSIMDNLVPQPTASDNNKVLTSVNGVPTWSVSSSTTTSTSSPTIDKLAGKTMVCFGDSLMSGNGWQGGFANCIMENHPSLTVINRAVGGATLIENDVQNYIYIQFREYYTEGNPAPDIILFDGGGNDCAYRSPIGTGRLDSCYINGTHSTMCDALEYLIYAIKTVYPTTKLLYISTPMSQQWDTEEIPSVPTQNIQMQYVVAKEKVLEKWGIPKADLRREGNLTSCIESQLTTYYIDSMHLNEAGYRYVSPVIENALNKLF